MSVRLPSVMDSLGDVNGDGYDDVLVGAELYDGALANQGKVELHLGEPAPRKYEALVEICYSYQIARGFLLQPNFQYIWQPGGGSGVDDATVVGARTSISF